MPSLQRRARATKGTVPIFAPAKMGLSLQIPPKFADSALGRPAARQHPAGSKLRLAIDQHRLLPAVEFPPG